MVARKKKPDTRPQPGLGGEELPLQAGGPGSDMTKLYANKYTNEDSMLWQ